MPRVLVDYRRLGGAVIALTGRAWLDCKVEPGKRRFDDPDDQVRRELAVALQRKIRVVPLLVGGAGRVRNRLLSSQEQ